MRARYVWDYDISEQEFDALLEAGPPGDDSTAPGPRPV